MWYFTHLFTCPYLFRKGTPQTLSSRPKSAKEPGSMTSPLSKNSQPHPPRSADSSGREIPLPDEVTMAMPDHVNKGMFLTNMLKVADP